MYWAGLSLFWFLLGLFSAVGAQSKGTRGGRYFLVGVLLGPIRPTVTWFLVRQIDLAMRYHDQGRYEQAEPLYQWALTIDCKVYGVTHLNVALILHNLAELYRAQGRYAPAESLYQRALAIRAESFCPESLVAQSLYGLAEVYRAQGQYAPAESLYLRVLALWEKTDPEHPLVTQSLYSLVELYTTQGCVQLLRSLTELYQDQGPYAPAEPLYQRALAIRDKTDPEAGTLEAGRQTGFRSSPAALKE
jgi:tetratricopeptide (TPR) repeat protein